MRGSIFIRKAPRRSARVPAETGILATFGFATFVALFCSLAAADEKVFTSLSLVDIPTTGYTQEPFLAVSGDVLLLSWLEPQSSGVAVRFARMEDDDWSVPATVAQGEDIFVNWADFPSVAALGDESVALHWLRETGRSGFDYDVALSISRDSGNTWSDPITPHSDRSASQHGFVTMSGAPDGSLDLLWLDGRAYGKLGFGDEPDAMQLRATRISPAGRLEKDHPVDLKTCSCCQTASARLDDGSLIVAYRDRTDGEIRDISVVRLRNGKWSAPLKVHQDGWEISGCPVNGPAIAAQGDRVAVAWFTGAADVAAVKLAFSDDRGESFAAPIRIDVGDPLGRVDTMLLVDGSALVTWLEWEGNEEVLWACRVVYGSGCIARQELTRNSSPASMNFPRMALIGQTVYFAMTDPVNTRLSTIKLMRGTLPDLD